ncbi:helix-turn-helix domain-containing protein [Paenibacillus graminis]|uniref:helix-turn-helix domain-containing protein n=1 Tax=Paenibacillus graminis TaxID=189425 RepID=UPI0004720E87|nr:helix-turn-helix transcriptional regulator [Paenibacillus graminis]
MRRKLTDVDKKLMEKMASNLKAVLEKQGITQKELSEKSGISTSAISEYANGKTLMTPSTVFLFAEKLGVANGDIDPRFRDTEKIKKDLPINLTGAALDELPIETLDIHNLTKNGIPLTEKQKKNLVKILNSALDLMDLE